MEFLGFVEQINTIEAALTVMEKSGHPDATTVLDPFHVFRGGGSIYLIGKLMPRQIAISHFNDTPAEPPREQQHDGDRVLPGYGHLDLKHYLSLLEQIGYDGYLSLELFSERFLGNAIRSRWPGLVSRKCGRSSKATDNATAGDLREFNFG